jgi:NDP-sugar pyrophosphorylase family protein
MKAMIFAAGLGTRLRPLTNDRPKAMVEVEGRPLLEIQILRLKALGFTELVVNVHHFADLIIDFLREKEHFGLRIHISDERDLLLDTGGGLSRARPLLEGKEPFFVCNVDVLTDLDPRALARAHQSAGALATLAVRDRHTSRYLLFDQDLRLAGWRNEKTGEVRGKPPEDANPLAFSGLHVIDPTIFPLIRHRGVFSIIDVYLELMAEHKIIGFRHDEGIWLDVGKPPELEAAAAIVSQIQGFGGDVGAGQ